MSHSGEKLLTPGELADELKVSRRTLDQWRWVGIGPAYVRLHGSGRIRYERDVVQAWIAAGRRASTSDPGEAAA